MKKTLILALTVFSCFMLSTSVFAQNSASTQQVGNSNDRISSGTVTEITGNNVKAVDNTTGEIVEFIHPGAQVTFVVGDSVTYILIDRPKGNPPIVADVKKPR